MADGNQELLQAFDMLAKSVNRVQMGNAVRRAQDQVDQVRQNQDMNDFEKIKAQQSIAQNVASSVLAAGGDAAYAEQARLSMAPNIPDGAMRQLEATGSPTLAGAQDKVRLQNQKMEFDKLKLENKLKEELQSQHMDALKEIAGMKLAPKEAQAVTKFTKDFDPSGARTGVFGKLEQTRTKAVALNALFQQFPDYNIPKAQTAELASGIAGLVNGGSAQSQQQIHDIMFKSGVGNVNEFVGWLTNDPRGLEQQDAMKMLQHTAQREQQVTEQQMGDIINLRHDNASDSVSNPEAKAKLAKARDRSLRTFAPSYNAPNQAPSAQNGQGYPVGGQQQGGMPNPMQFIKLNP